MNLLANTSTPALELELARILDLANKQNLQLPQTLSEAEGYKGPPIEALCLMQEHMLGKTLIDLALADARFGERGAVILNTDNGGTGFYPRFFAGSMVRRLVQTQSVDSAVAWLSKVLATPSATGHFISAIYGIQITESVVLNSETRLVPMDAVPASDQKTNVQSGSAGGDASFANWSPPCAALMTRVYIEPFTRALAEVGEPNDKPTDRLISTEHEAIALALTALGPVTPIIIRHWFTFDDPDLQLATQADNISGSQILEIAPMPTIDVPPLAPSAVETFIPAYLGMADFNRRIAETALHRIRQSRARHGSGNAAIELCTALEVLHRNRRKEDRELHRHSTWIARKIGSDDPERARIEKLFEDLYKIRNLLVHGSQFDATSESHAIVAACTDLCSRLIRLEVEQAASNPPSLPEAP